MISELADILYTKSNIDSASEYLRKRGVDSQGMRFPPVLSGKDPSPFLYLSKHMPPHLFTDTIYFPITDIENPKTLIGFDARYMGEDKSRLRYRKFKEEGNSFLLYYTKPLSEIDANAPMIVTEGVVDAETLRPLGFPVISPLTAMHSFKFCCFLKAMSNNIYIAYDNDSSGQQAVKNMVKEIKIQDEFQKAFKFLNFQGKDLNDSYREYGRDYLFNILKAQLI